MVLKLVEEYGHEGQLRCMLLTHGWLVLIIPFSVIGGMPRGSSQLRSYEVMKLEDPKMG
jgi:hypothetical protein